MYDKSAEIHTVNKGVFWPRSSPREENLFTLWGGIRTVCVNNWQSKALRFCSFHYPSSNECKVKLFTPRDKLAFEAEVRRTRRILNNNPTALTGSGAKLSQPGPSGLGLQKCDVFPGKLFLVERLEMRMMLYRRAKRVKKLNFGMVGQGFFSDKQFLLGLNEKFARMVSSG